MSKDKKSSGFGKTLLVAMIGLGLGAGGLWYYASSTGGLPGLGAAANAKPAESKQVAAETPVQDVDYEPIFLELDPITVTLRNGYESRVLYTGVTLRVGDKESQERLVRYMPVIRSRVLSELNALPADKVSDPQEMDNARDRIRRIAAAPISPERRGQQITDVLFTSYVVQ